MEELYPGKILPIDPKFMPVMERLQKAWDRAHAAAGIAMDARVSAQKMSDMTITDCFPELLGEWVVDFDLENNRMVLRHKKRE